MPRISSGEPSAAAVPYCAGMPDTCLYISVVITSIPQVALIAKRGGEWQGSYALIDFDELTYSAYLNALIEGRPRRNNPYLEKDHQDIGESHFSIQFLPAYVVAMPARALGVSTSTAFILLTPIMAIASSLAIFWLLCERPCSRP